MPDDNQQGGNPRMALIGLLAVVVIFAVCWWLARALYTSGKMQDCLMSGRSNCAPIESPR